MGSAWPAREGAPSFAFGSFEVEVDRARVRRDGQQVALRPKTFALLVHLADRAGTVVGKQELMDAVWPGLVVTDDSLTQAISELRGVLDDREQKLIKTIPKRGYLFDAAVHPAPEPAKGPPGVEAPEASPAPQRRRWAAATRCPTARCRRRNRRCTLRDRVATRRSESVSSRAARWP